MLKASSACWLDCRKTSSSTDGVPLGGLARLGSAVAQQMVGFGTFDALPQHPFHDEDAPINVMAAMAASEMPSNTLERRNSSVPCETLLSAIPNANLNGAVRLNISEVFRRKVTGINYLEGGDPAAVVDIPSSSHPVSSIAQDRYVLVV